MMIIIELIFPTFLTKSFNVAYIFSNPFVTFDLFFLQLFKLLIEGYKLEFDLIKYC